MDQLALNFEPGLSQKYASVTECCATVIYRAGLGRVAGKLDMAPSNLSAALSGARKLGADDLEKLIEVTGDHEPLHYLIDKFLREKPTKAAMLAEARQLMAQLTRAVQAIEND